MKDTNEPLVVERTPYGEPHDTELPTGAVPRPMMRPARTARLELYRVAPVGTKRQTLDIAKRQLGLARDAIAFGGWTQGVLAVEEGDFECQPIDPKARAWSLGGAMFKAFGVGEYWHGTPADIAVAAVRQSIRNRHNCTALYFNDMVASSASDVIAEINVAIDLLDEIIDERGL